MMPPDNTPARREIDVDVEPEALAAALDDAVDDLPRLSFEQLHMSIYECIDAERGLYAGPEGNYYRSPYQR